MALFVVAVKNITFLFYNYQRPVKPLPTTLNDEVYKIKSYSFTIMTSLLLGYS